MGGGGVEVDGGGGGTAIIISLLLQWHPPTADTHLLPHMNNTCLQDKTTVFILIT